MQLPLGRHDLSQRQPPAQGTPEAGAREAPAARPLGREPGVVLRVGASQSSHQARRPRRDLHGRPGPRRTGRARPAYLEGTYSEVYPDKSEDIEGHAEVLQAVLLSRPHRLACHAGNPGSIHEGGELGYSLSHAYGAALDNPDLIVACVVGDGEAETGPLATAWHSNKFINPMRDGAVLPILNLNGYKIANPTILARISHEELEALFVGYGYKPYFVEGGEPSEMHQKMAATLDAAIGEIRAIQKKAGDSGQGRAAALAHDRAALAQGLDRAEGDRRPQGRGLLAFAPGALLRRARQSRELQLLEDWLRSYKPEELFDADGRLRAELRALAPEGKRRMSANPHANGGVLRRELKLPDFRDYAVEVPHPGKVLYENTRPLGEFLRDMMRDNMTNFPRLRSRRDRLQPPAVDLRSQQEDLAGRHAAGGCRWRRAGARRARDGDAFGAHADGLAGRLPALRPPRLLPYLRGLRARGGLDVQPARQMAGHLQEPRAVARVGGLGEHSAVVDRAGGRITTASRTRTRASSTW